jgi:hypothetical protein
VNEAACSSIEENKLEEVINSDNSCDKILM